MASAFCMRSTPSRLATTGSRATLTFVDEFELPARTDDERGAAPDYGVLWDDCVWLVELKTERGSHRADQIPTYFELAAHHYPGHRIELTYLTGPMEYAFEPLQTSDPLTHQT